MDALAERWEAGLKEGFEAKKCEPTDERHVLCPARRW